MTPFSPRTWICIAAAVGGTVKPQLPEGPHGPIAAHLSGNPKAAVEWLKKNQTGEVPAAIVHPAIGPIDLIWGEAGDPAKGFKDRFGLSHILARHEEMRPQIGELGNIVSSLPVKLTRGDKVWLENDRYRAIVSRVWQPSKAASPKGKTWLLTAFEPKSNCPPPPIF